MEEGAHPQIELLLQALEVQWDRVEGNRVEGDRVELPRAGARKTKDDRGRRALLGLESPSEGGEILRRSRAQVVEIGTVARERFRPAESRHHTIARG